MKADDGVVGVAEGEPFTLADDAESATPTFGVPQLPRLQPHHDLALPTQHGLFVTHRQQTRCHQGRTHARTARGASRDLNI